MCLATSWGCLLPAAQPHCVVILLQGATFKRTRTRVVLMNGLASLALMACLQGAVDGFYAGTVKGVELGAEVRHPSQLLLHIHVLLRASHADGPVSSVSAQRSS